MRQNINRVNHVVWVCEPENLETYVGKLSDLFEIVFDGPCVREDFGAKIWLSWEAGLEIVAPVIADRPVAQMLRAHLDRQGESVFSVTVGVANIDRMREKATTLGWTVGDIMQNLGNEPFAHKTSVMKESMIGPMMNTIIQAGEIVYNDTALRRGAEPDDRR